MKYGCDRPGKYSYFQEINPKSGMWSIHVQLYVSLPFAGKYIHNIYLLQVMKFGELVTVFSVLFLVTFSMGDGAPQWRPQGRFGKRLDQRFPSPWQQSKYTHNINFTLHLFKTYCSQKKIGIGFWSVYHLFTITVKIPFFNMFDHKLPIWEFNTSHTILKKKNRWLPFVFCC